METVHTTCIKKKSNLKPSQVHFVQRKSSKEQLHKRHIKLMLQIYIRLMKKDFIQRLDIRANCNN